MFFLRWRHPAAICLSFAVNQLIMRCALVVSCIWALPITNAQSSSATNSPNNGAVNARVNAAVADAKARGITSVSLPAMKKMPTGVTTLEKAAERYSLLLARPVVANTIVRSGESIETWYLLQTVEAIRTQLFIPKSVDPPLPSSLDLPNITNQLLLLTSGGQVKINGVEVFEQFDQGKPLQIGTTYLFVVYLEANGKAAVLASPDSVFQVSSNLDTLEPIAPAPLAKDVVSYYQSSLMAVRNKLRSVPQR